MSVSEAFSGGNRKLATALHTIAFTQIRKGGCGEPLYRRRIAEGDSHARALRCLKRHLCRVVYRRMRGDGPGSESDVVAVTLDEVSGIHTARLSG
jgi:transposase